MKTSLEKTRQKIAGAPRFAVSAELDQKVMASLGLSKAEPRHQVERAEMIEDIPLFPEGWMAQWLQRSFRQFSYVAVILAVVLTGSWLLNQDSYSNHLDKARFALADLQSVLDGKPVGTVTWIPMALAEGLFPVVVNDTQVVGLAQEVVRETEKAIQLVGGNSDPVAVGKALVEVVALQDQTVPVFAAAVEAVGSDEAVQTVAEALEKTATNQSVVAKAHDFVLKSVSKGEKKVAIDIQTASGIKSALPTGQIDEGKRLEKAKAAYLEAKTQIENLKVSGADADVVEKLQSKLQKVVSAFEDGKIGRANGLSVAIAAQGKHWVKRGSRIKAMEEGESEKGDERFGDEAKPESNLKGSKMPDSKKEAEEPKDSEGDVVIHVKKDGVEILKRDEAKGEKAKNDFWQGISDGMKNEVRVEKPEGSELKRIKESEGSEHVRVEKIERAGSDLKNEDAEKRDAMRESSKLDDSRPKIPRVEKERWGQSEKRGEKDGD